MKTNKVYFNSIDEYIGTFPEETQKLLEEVRGTNELPRRKRTGYPSGINLLAAKRRGIGPVKE